ncbi:hypothetical protein DKT74_36925 [Streptomyces sp. ZEA17I]|nr:hypothetical protein DKT74_36925 [Streptomyces sp. ZEA17I]
MTFGTLLSSQGTDASFGPVSPGPSGRFPSFTSLSCCLAFPTLSDAFQCPIPVEAGPAPRFPGLFAFALFPFRRIRLYQILSGLTPSQRGLSSRLLGRSDAQTLADSSGGS